MKIKSNLINLATRALAESANVQTMTHFANELIYDYDIYKRTGFRESMAIPNRDAASQIVNDMVSAGLFNHFITLLIRIHTEGYQGHKTQIAHLKEIIKEIQDMGFIYDQHNKMFVEDPDVRRTRNWGGLLQGHEYFLSFLRLDIVGNSKLVRKYPENIIKATYDDLRIMVQDAIEKRNGRIWNWEGDGGMVAFYFANKNLSATLSGMEVINELFIYNKMKCRLDEPLQVRIAVHSGICDYTEDMEELMKNDVIKQTIEIEAKHTQPNSLTISSSVCSSFESALYNCFTLIPVDARTKYCTYQIKLEQ